MLNLRIGESKIFDYPCDNPVDCHSIEVKLKRGKYNFECYGAAGGDAGKGKGGFGAYVSGIISLSTSHIFYLFIGAKGHTQLAAKSFNGGGRGPTRRVDGVLAASGGGSTDIRLINNDNQAGLLSRIMVAGAGGGAESFETGPKGGNAGFFNGEDGQKAIRYATQNQISVP